MTQTAKKLRDWYQVWIGSTREKGKVRWGWWIKGVIWLLLFVFFIQVFFIHSLQTGGLPAIVAVLLPSSPSAAIVARNDLPAFTVLTREKIAIMQGDQESNPSPQDSLSLKGQEQALYQRVTLRSYDKGEKIQLSDLGPRLPAVRGYQIREVKASASLAWIQADDTLTFTLINTACTSGETSPKTNIICTYQPDASPPLLKDVIIIQVGKTGQNGLIALLVAIPLGENAGSLAFLNAGSSSVVAYPAAVITGVSTTAWPFVA